MIFSVCEQFLIPLKESQDETVYSRLLGTMLRISRMWKEESFSRQIFLSSHAT